MLNEEDLKIDVFRTNTQSLNENSRGVRITHKPSGISVTKVAGKYEWNRDQALRELTRKIDERHNANDTRAQDRREENERIRERIQRTTNRTLTER